ncbi:DNA topoisomerase I [Pedobacter yulinensis]|uniref:DNA topoisomerase n=1 Tax=Pedobacter yulinensis TaxID=2126353 RepID=A0A2T3HIE7_9SPHI|nr:DNA topoisomerase IB [Pedobacter yulinensis]PST82200.1 DNA topoisomerase I [Pedobacter yulinensis]
MIDTLQEVKESGLIYVTDSTAGIRRMGEPGAFYYLDAKGARVTDEKQLDRVKKLVLPPAWTNVWIAVSPNAYLQATGIDAAGRKQYRYHPKWTSRRSDAKYFRLAEFARVLPRARKQILTDLRRKKLDERKVLAICVDVMQKTLIRIGNESYKRKHGSFGLSTLRDKHAVINGSKLELSFVGKKGVQQQVRLTDRNLAKLVKKCREIPGQELFQYYLPDGSRRSVDSGRINAYIQEITGSDFTAKDFRTWGGTLEAFRQMAQCFQAGDQRPRKKLIVDVLDCVAFKLGNTRAVCKSSYVYPMLLEAFENDQLGQFLKKVKPAQKTQLSGLESDEKVLLAFLKAVSAEVAAIKEAPQKGKAGRSAPQAATEN